MQLHELISEISDRALEDLTTDFDPRDPDNQVEAKRKLEYWLQNLVIRAGTLV